MKTLLTIIISLLICSASFAQNAPQQVNSQNEFYSAFLEPWKIPQLLIFFVEQMHTPFIVTIQRL